MQRYFIHCYWHLNTNRMRVVYVGKCTESEARERFDAAARENGGFELLTLHDGGGHEIRRHIHERKGESPVHHDPLAGWRDLRLSFGGLPGRG